MTTRKDRLRKLVTVQEKLKSLHETRHAGFLAAASKERIEASELAETFDKAGSFGSLFPELYNRRISAALGREQAHLALSRVEAGHVATATARTNMVERAYQEVRTKHDRDATDRETLDMVERKATAEGGK